MLWPVQRRRVLRLVRVIRVMNVTWTTEVSAVIIVHSTRAIVSSTIGGKFMYKKPKVIEAHSNPI